MVANMPSSVVVWNNVYYIWLYSAKVILLYIYLFTRRQANTNGSMADVFFTQCLHILAAFLASLGHEISEVVTRPCISCDIYRFIGGSLVRFSMAIEDSLYGSFFLENWVAFY
jgi:hypothetical protein